MALRPRAVITTSYPTAAETARVFGMSSKEYREIRAFVTEYLERHGKPRRKSNDKRKTPARRREASRS